MTKTILFAATNTYKAKMPHSGIFAFFYIVGKEEWQSMQELIEHRDSINRQLALHCVPMTDAVQRKAKASVCG